jgi:hypothetical protein
VNLKEAYLQQVQFSFMVSRKYIEDLTDADLLVRSVVGTNHIAWQLGHLITSTDRFLQALGHSGLKLPEGFAERHDKSTAGSDDPAHFETQATYLALLDQCLAASLAAIETTPESAYDNPGPEPMRAYAPTVSSVLMLMGTHWLMHAGQYVPVRRKLGKPALF